MKKYWAEIHRMHQVKIDSEWNEEIKKYMQGMTMSREIA